MLSDMAKARLECLEEDGDEMAATLIKFNSILPDYIRDNTDDGYLRAEIKTRGIGYVDFSILDEVEWLHDGLINQAIKEICRGNMEFEKPDYSFSDPRDFDRYVASL